MRIIPQITLNGHTKQLTAVQRYKVSKRELKTNLQTNKKNELKKRNRQTNKQTSSQSWKAQAKANRTLKNDNFLTCKRTPFVTVMFSY